MSLSYYISQPKTEYYCAYQLVEENKKLGDVLDITLFLYYFTAGRHFRMLPSKYLCHYANQDCYYFFDEIQYATHWDKWLKTIYDTQLETKMVATGSVSPVIVKGSTESGAGRWSIIQIPKLSFYEYCSLVGIPDIDLDKRLRPTGFLALSRQEQTEVMMKLSVVQNHFNRYLQVGGFPELALSENDLMAQQMLLEDVVDKVLKKDLPSIYNIRNAAELERIFLYLCNVSSDIDSMDAIAVYATLIVVYFSGNFYLKNGPL